MEPIATTVYFNDSLPIQVDIPKDI